VVLNHPTVDALRRLAVNVAVALVPLALAREGGPSLAGGRLRLAVGGGGPLLRDAEAPEFRQRRGRDRLRLDLREQVVGFTRSRLGGRVEKPIARLG